MNRSRIARAGFLVFSLSFAGCSENSSESPLGGPSSTSSPDGGSERVVDAAAVALDAALGAQDDAGTVQPSDAGVVKDASAKTDGALPDSGTLNPSVPPASNFDLTVWNLTIPTLPSATVISTTALLSGFTDAYFYTGSDGAMTFWSPVTGGTTTGSAYPRSELRETLADGGLAGWMLGAGTATLRATASVLAVPGTGKVVVGQIHDNAAVDYPLVKLVYDSGALYANVQTSTSSSGGTDTPNLATAVGLGVQFDYTIELTKTGALTVTVNGTSQTVTVDPSFKTVGLYFKAGDYVQDNTGASSSGGEVAFYALHIDHS